MRSEPAPFDDAAAEWSRTLLILCREDVRAEFPSPLVQKLCRQAGRVQQFSFAPVLLAITTKWYVHVLFRYGREVEMMPAAMVQKMAGQVILMDTLLYQDDRPVDRIVEAAEKCRGVPVED